MLGLEISSVAVWAKAIMAQEYVGWSNVPFAEGRFRRAYIGEYLDSQSGNRQLAVVKKYKNADLWNATDYDSCLEMNKQAQAMTTGFNLFSGTKIPLRFTKVSVLGVLKTKQTFSFKENEYVLVEDYIPGKFEKWCSNYGYISHLSPEMQAFMHWSWVHSSGEKMISDLQGAFETVTNHRNKLSLYYTLTDPAMLSINSQYGVTDTGIEGMAMFFLNHQCNVFCEDLPRPDMSDLIPQDQLSASMKLLKDVENATIYTHELKFSPRVRERIATVFKRVAIFGGY